MSDAAAPAPAPTEPDAPAPQSPPPAPADGGAPLLRSTPGWVPAAVVAGAVVVLLGYVVREIRFGAGTEGGSSFADDLARVFFLLGATSLAAGYGGFLLARVPLAGAFEAMLYTALAAGSYALGASVLLHSLAGKADSLFFVAWFGLAGKQAALAAIAGGILCAAGFGVGFWFTARIVWPYFRAGVALNVLLMVHLVVGLLGVVSFLNKRFTATSIGTGLDLTEGGQFTLGSKTRAILDGVAGELRAVLLDYREARRLSAGGGGRRLDEVTARVKPLLLQFEAANSRIRQEILNPLRRPQDLEKTITEFGMEASLPSITGDEDVLLLAYRPPGEKIWARTRLLRLDHEFMDVSSLGTDRFRGEGILANALNEVVFPSRKVYFLSGHDERTTDAGPAQRSLSVFVEALRGENLTTGPLNLLKEGRVPEDAALLVLAGPQAPLDPKEVDLLRAYLQGGGALLAMIDSPEKGQPATGIEEILSSFGITVRRDAMIVSWHVERTLQGDVPTPIVDLILGKDEFGRHELMEALRRTDLQLAFMGACPVFKAETAPAGVKAAELAFAPRAIGDFASWAIVNFPGRPQELRPLPGDIVDRRLPVGVAAEKGGGETGKGGGRVVVFGDCDFATDARLNPRSRYAVPANRTLLINAVSWAVRRDLIAIDPKTLETERVTLRPQDAELAFWSTVVALPLVVLGLAVGVWWTRRR